MAKIVKINGKNHWLNASGIPVLRTRIEKEEVQRERVSNRAIKMAIQTSKQLQKFNDDVVKLIDDYLDKIADTYGEEWQGSATITNFDQTERIDIKISKQIAFNEHFAIGEKKIFNYIDKQADALQGDLASLVRIAFSRNSKGFIDPKKIFELKKLKIKSKVWKEAMDLIDKSTYVKSTTRYINFFVKDKNGSWESIPLNFSRL